MTFLAPSFLFAAAAAAALTVGLHFMVTRQPPSASLPTARFIPAMATSIVAPARRPHDLLLLLLRVMVIGLVGAAFAQPHLAPRRSHVARIVVADRSRDVADIQTVRDSVHRLLRDGDGLVVFDSAAHVVGMAGASDTAASLQRRAVRGSLSSALIIARRLASGWRDRADSLELDLVSPLTADEIDAGTPAVRALWSGRIRVVPVAATHDSLAPPTIAVHGAADDPLRAARPLITRERPGTTRTDLAAGVRLVRDHATAADSAWARSDHGRVLVEWPARGMTPPWAPRRPVDTAGAVVVLRPPSFAVVAAFPRQWRLEVGPGARVRARWVDGEPAVNERPLGSGCVRDVAIDVAASGDLVLRPEMAQLIATVVRPCGDEWEPVMPERRSDAAMIEGTGRLLATRVIAPADGADEPTVPWILAAAFFLVAVEPWARAARARPARPPVAPAWRA